MARPRLSLVTAAAVPSPTREGEPPTAPQPGPMPVHVSCLAALAPRPCWPRPRRVIEPTLQ